MVFCVQSFMCGFMVVLAIFCVVCQRHSFLGILLGFEIFSLVLFYWFVSLLGDMQKSVGFSLVFFCFEVCVMSVCLALLVGLVKCAGGDYVGAVSSSYNL
uniref:NADH dehydrogenase subunit 4L n=1 Tax=Sinohyriopsis cumingii TaxID=165450 RepID=A0A0C4G3I3_SINCU|nr:NADH dehydrogenase subunit 4L [Sinohyriopsis cumingii]